MKHLKKFEGISFHDLTLEIKDLFQDLEDDFNVGIDSNKQTITSAFDWYTLSIIFYDLTIPEKFLPILSQYIDRVEDILPLEVREFMLFGSLPPITGVGRGGMVGNVIRSKDKTWIKELEEINTYFRSGDYVGTHQGKLRTLVVQMSGPSENSEVV